MRSLFLALAFILLTLFSQSLSASEASKGSTPLYLQLKGYLDGDIIASSIALIDQAGHPTQLVIELNSSGAEAVNLFDLAKKIYEEKNQYGMRLVVYIDDSALAGAAILPFLADELYTSPFVAWGDIASGNKERAMPLSLLRSRVVGLVQGEGQRAELLRALAAAMADPSFSITFSPDGAWQITSQAAATAEVLVLNQYEQQKLSLIQGVLRPEQFRQRFLPPHVPRQLTPAPSPLSSSASEGLQKQSPSFTDNIHYNAEGKNTVGFLTIEGEGGITQSTWLQIKSGLDYYRKSKPIFVILRLNTPGGEVFAAEKIADALQELDIHYKIPVVAYIDKWAMSAGAMLAYSCRFIVSAKDGSMGAAEPVIIGDGKMEAASEKVNSALRADFASRAAFFGRNPLIAEAMVDKDIILVLRHGKLVKLASEQDILRGGLDPDEVVSAKGKLLTLDAEQMRRLGVADLILQPYQLEHLSAEQQHSGHWPASKLALFQSPFFDKIPQAEIDAYHMDWKTAFFAFLAHPMVSSLLFLGLMLGFYMELSHPGATLPGGVALTCLVLIILSSFALEIGSWLEVIIIAVGAVLLLVEILIIPSFGIIGVLGLLLLFGGLLALMLPSISTVAFDFDSHSYNAAGQLLIEKLQWFFATIVIGFILIALVARYISPTLSRWSSLVLQGSEQQGFIAGIPTKELPAVASKGVAASSLRPGGKVLINDLQYDAISRGPFIEKGSQIVVVGRDGSTLIVNLAENPS